MKQHQELIKEIDDTKLHYGQAAFWWIGQHSFILKTENQTLYLDPYISPRASRMTESPLTAEEILNADLIFGSHDHIDHIDHEAWKIIYKNKPEQKFVVPEILIDKLAKELAIPKENFIGMTDNFSVEVDGINITAIASAHEFLDKDYESDLYPYLGFIIDVDGVTVYHSGDTCKYEGLETKLLGYKLDIAFVPINGRDAVKYKRNTIGNMTYQEAVDLCGSIKPKISVPGHYGMFAHNTENPQLFLDYINVKYPDLKAIIPIHAEKTVIDYLNILQGLQELFDLIFN